MSERYIIEKAGKAYGLMVRQGRDYVFHASAPEAQPINGKTFAHPSEVLREIDGMAGVDDKNGPPPPNS